MAKNKVLYEGAFAADTRNIINHNFQDVGYCTTQLDAVTGTTGATLTNIPGMVTDTLAIGTYRLKIHLSTISTSSSGLNIALKQNNGAVIGALNATVMEYSASAVAVKVFTTTTDQALIVDSDIIVLAVDIEGILTITTAGTLQLQMAQDDAHTDTASVKLGSIMTLTQIATN